MNTHHIQHYIDIHNSNSRYGSNNDPAVSLAQMHRIAVNNDCKNVLDYGCGKGVLVEYLNTQGVQCTGYDPAVPIFSQIPSFEDNYDCILCLDVLEHITHEDINEVLTHIKNFKAKKIVFNVALRKAVQLLPDGTNAHTIVENKTWWENKFNDILSNYKINTIDHAQGNHWTVILSTE